ncbi:MAG TPA: penicillin acylase family protein [Terriglobales bacterium]|nr:penicillin acylase family protein [Terriglobales bacterium]
MKWLRAVVSLLIAAAAFWGLDNRHGRVPPLGKLLDPFAGFWQNGTRGDALPVELSVPGLENEVRVAWDARHVPHIFARNDHDLFFAQGYLTARDRLWQMEFQAFYAGGRLAEIIGREGLDSDRFNRRFGMGWAAERSVEARSRDPESLAPGQAYADGVNAWIRRLRRKDFPIEYKVLDYAPEPWSPLDSALLLKYMSYDLTGYNDERWMTAARKALGEAVVDELFPFEPPKFVEPVIPPGTAWDLAPVAAPKAGGGPLPIGPAAAATPESGPTDASSSAAWVKAPDPDWPEPGSNNWAVSGALTKSGRPILANDPHLRLTLPSIWYEVQLAAPGMNAAGVSIPGTPLVIIGHNDRIAWGFTNAGSDVLDWYAVQFKDASHREYLYGGQWRKASVRTEVIKVRGEMPFVDRVVYTHHGPVVWLEGEPAPANRAVPAGAALRWAAHDPSNEILAFDRLDRARDYEGYLGALAAWDCPAQNFAFAAADGTIAIWHNGKFPLRPKGAGRYILDGSNPAEEWPGWVPHGQNPHVKDPARGFVSSANQKPTGASYPYYLGWDYASFERGNRINELLGRMRAVTPEDMARMQNDDLSLRARMVLPRLLREIGERDLSPDEKWALSELGGWNFENRAGLAAPTIFAELWSEFNAKTWNDEKKGDLAGMRWPRSQVVIDLVLNQPDSGFFDDRTTPQRESLADIANAAFRASVKTLRSECGPPGKSWTWGERRKAGIGHLGRMPGFGREKLPMDGGGNAINASGPGFGPSWRMVVELGSEVKAWGILPGGASGNPGSRYYDTGVDDWVAGRIYPLLFLKSADDAQPGVVARTVLRGVR